MAVTRGRVLTMLGLFLAASAGVAARLVWMQGMASDRFTALAASQRERRLVLPAQRGSILERDGSPLAMSVDGGTVFANPRAVSDPRGAAAALSPLLGAPPTEIEARLASKKGFVYLARKIEPDRAEQVENLELPGIGILAEPKRLYPAGQLAAHVIGFVGLDNQGLAGLESRFDRLLRGKPGELLAERDPGGRPIPGGRSQETAPVAGDDVVLTIDREIQHAAEAALAGAVQAFSARGGSVIVMRSDTGEVLAMANLPAFDPNDFGAAPPDAYRNRALVDVYEPGSVNKLVTVAAALESGVVRTGDVFSVPDSLEIAGKVFHDAHPHPRVDLTVAGVVEQSSNVGAIEVAVKVGRDRMHEFLGRFGYGRPTGTGFPGEAAGILPPPERWWGTSLPTIAVGQGVAATPMQVVSAYATVANEGVRVQPRLVSALVGPDGRRRTIEPAPERRVVTPETARRLTQILVRVVDGENGTGKLGAVPGYRVAGKTGTAQKPRRGGGYEGHVASFVGFAPAERPRVVVGIMLDEPTPIWGGATAAPTFREVMAFSLAHLRIGPGPALPPEGIPLPAPGRSGGASIGPRD